MRWLPIVLFVLALVWLAGGVSRFAYPVGTLRVRWLRRLQGVLLVTGGALLGVTAFTLFFRA